jgi:UDP-N-acetyl-D-mannosaminuronic acid dehydrogenase
VAVLGLTFKANSDDLRDSLSAKLVRLLERELATVTQHDSVVPTLDGPLERVVTDADVVICAMNHDEYVTPEALGTIRAYAAADCLLVDPWNAFGAAEVFTRIDELDGAGAAVSDAASVST